MNFSSWTSSFPFYAIEAFSTPPSSTHINMSQGSSILASTAIFRLITLLHSPSTSLPGAISPFLCVRCSPEPSKPSLKVSLRHSHNMRSANALHKGWERKSQRHCSCRPLGAHLKVSSLTLQHQPRTSGGYCCWFGARPRRRVY